MHDLHILLQSQILSHSGRCADYAKFHSTQHTCHRHKQVHKKNLFTVTEGKHEYYKKPKGWQKYANKNIHERTVILYFKRQSRRHTAPKQSPTRLDSADHRVSKDSSWDYDRLQIIAASGEALPILLEETIILWSKFVNDLIFIFVYPWGSDWRKVPLHFMVVQDNSSQNHVVKRSKHHIKHHTLFWMCRSTSWWYCTILHRITLWKIFK